MSVPNKAKLRQLFIKFYQEHDPVTLNGGFDISGLVEFTTTKGVDVVNRMLHKKYGQMIDFNEELEGGKAAFTRQSAAFTASTFILSKEQEYRTKLSNFFNKVDPNMMSSAREVQFEKLVKFAMLNGLDKLNEKLKLKYGEGVEEGGEVTNDHSHMNTANVVTGNSGLNPFKLDRNRLRDDLDTFYTEMEDYGQLEVLDEMTDWACQIGIIEFDKKLRQLYGTTLNDFLEDIRRPGHENYIEPTARPLPAMGRDLPPIEEDEGFDIVMETILVPATAREFEDMTDDDILDELKAFYSTYDEDNLSNLERVLELCRNIGRAKLDEHLLKIYDAKLTPVPAFIEHTVEKKVPRPRRNVPSLPPAEIPRSPSPPGFGQRELPPVEDGFQGTAPPIPTFRPPPGLAGANNMNSFQANLHMAVQGGGQLKKAKPVRQAPPEEEEEFIPEFMRKAREKRKIIEDGEALVRDADGTVMKVNILIDVCKDYRLDVMSGICVCGFSREDHIWGEKNRKKKKRR